ncbi:hypothetical protein IE81DRAFT_315946 [Ceraceosorus guamensis]|uniref:SWR1-complex protein 4 n=1 Tax=Ceraceosorus guamensis TaxID=1522189 RepID=A0A316VU21_9BASI|nr:hypothetical protein IE81DRAFT_315946 [Ceraceosorus guamensis]PWN40910.1 hypothetical protein IE81DRAFT_315946 [Ceraceosorus guamensis]
MATRSDVRDIFSLPDRTGASSSKPSKRTTNGPSNISSSTSSGPPGLLSTKSKSSKPKVDGMTRELYALLGDNAPTLNVSHAVVAGGHNEMFKFRPKFKKRPNKAQKWVMAPFRNPAREDDLVLHHWVRESEALEGKQAEHNKKGDSELTEVMDVDGEPFDEASEGNTKSKGRRLPPKDYKFSHFNTSSGVYSYSNDEYHQHLRDDDWTKEETDYLIELCQAYDLRFVVVHDRWEWRGGRARTIEDLKARYYAVCRRLIRSRITTSDMEARQHLLTTYSFDKARETERKKAVERLFSRSPAQLAEEEALYVEARRLEQNEARFAGEREDLLRLLGGWERLPNGDRATTAGLAAGLGYNTPSGTSIIEEASDGKRKKRKITDGAEEDAPAQSSRTGSSLSQKQKVELKQAQFDETHCIARFDPVPAAPFKAPYPHLQGTASSQPPVNPVPSNQISAHGAYLRSARVLAPRSTLLPRVHQTLAELRPPVGPRLVFPTQRNVERWEGLLGAVTAGLEMKRQLDRVESELRTQKARVDAQISAMKAAQAQSKTPAQIQQAGQAAAAAAEGALISQEEEAESAMVQ